MLDNQTCLLADLTDYDAVANDMIEAANGSSAPDEKSGCGTPVATPVAPRLPAYVRH
jgi:hypothetical protein